MAKFNPIKQARDYFSSLNQGRTQTGLISPVSRNQIVQPQRGFFPQVGQALTPFSQRVGQAVGQTVSNIGTGGLQLAGIGLNTAANRMQPGTPVSKVVAPLAQKTNQLALQRRQQAGLQNTGFKTFTQAVKPAVQTVGLAKSLTPAGMIGLGIAGGLGAAFDRRQGETRAQAFGRSAADIGLTTNALMPATDFLAQSVTGGKNLLTRQLTTRGVTGALNVLENEVIDRLNQINPTWGSRAASFGVGALLSPTSNKEFLKVLRKDSSPSERKAIGEILKDAQGRYRDVRSGKFSRQLREEIKRREPMINTMDYDQTGKRISMPLSRYVSDAQNLPIGMQARPKGGTKAIFEAEASMGLSPNTSSYLKELTNKDKPIRPGIGTKGRSLLREIKTKFVDSTAPIEDILNTAEKKYKFNVLPTQDIRNQIDRVLRSKTLASQFAEDNGLVDVIKSAPDLEVLDQYMIAKQARTVADFGKETGRDLVRDEALIKELGPQYDQFAQKVNQYSRKLLDYSVQSGLVDKKLADDLVKKYPEYVPLNRVFDELEQGSLPKGVGTKSIASLSRQTVVQKLQGSKRDIKSPIESLLLKTQDALAQGERNIAAKQLASYKDLPGMKGLITEVKQGTGGQHTFSYIDKGVKRTFQTTPDIAAAAKNLNQEQMGLIGKIISTPTRMLQLGATGLNIPFVVTNALKDEITGFVNSNKAASTSILNPVNFGKALFSAVKHDDLYDEVVRNAAGGTSFDIAREAPDLAVKRIRAQRNLVSKIKYTVVRPGELLRAVEDIVGRGEELGRIKNYRGTREALLKEGRTAQDAAILAAKAGRENTANFARKGEWGRVLNWMIPFFNAGIQGSRQLVRSFKNQPVQTGAKVAVSLFTPMAVATAWNLSDPERANIYKDIDEFEKENNIIIIPPGATKDSKGRWNIVKIPVPPGLSNLTTLVRRPLEQANGLDPVRFGEVANNLITAGTSLDVSSPNKLLSSVTPQGIKPFIESATNTNLFTGKKIVPEYMTSKAPEEQVRPYTSGTARAIGKVTNQSPLKVENFIRTGAGGVGSQLLNLSDTTLNKAGLIPDEQVGGESVGENLVKRFTKASGGSLTDKIYDDSEKVRQVESQVKSLLQAGQKDRAISVMQNNKDVLERAKNVKLIRSELDKNSELRNKILKDTRFSSEDKKKMINILTEKTYKLSVIYSKI